MADVFISYVSEDRNRAEALAHALAGSGFSVWWDRDLHGGADFSAEIERQLETARAVIVLWSKRSLTSQWVRDEAAAARDAGKLVPVRLDDASVPLGFRQLQTIDFGDWRSGDASHPAFVRVLASLRHFVSAVGDVTAAESRTVPRRSTRRAAVALAAGVAVLSLAMGLFYYTRDASMSTEGAIDPFSIAVLPIEHAGDPRLGELARTVRNDMTSALSTKNVALIGSASATAAAHAAYRLEGELQPIRENARLTLRLEEVATTRIEWTDTFEMPVDAATFEAAEYAALRVEWTTFALNVGRGIETGDEDARWFFTQGLLAYAEAFLGRRGDAQVAAHHFRNALRADSGLVDAHFWLAFLYINRLGISLRADDAGALAQRHAAAVLESNPADTFVLGAIALNFDLDAAGALAHFERARSVTADANLDSWIAQAHLARGDLELALRYLRSAAAGRSTIDSPGIALETAKALLFAGNPGGARTEIERTLRLTQDGSLLHGVALLMLTRICHALGDNACAVAATDRAWRAQGVRRAEWFPGVLALLGRNDEARHILADMEVRYARGTLPLSAFAVEAAVELGDLDEAFLWLDRTIDNRELVLLGPLHVSDRLESLRNDPRYDSVLQRIEALAPISGHEPTDPIVLLPDERG
jgi:tetratricopeptide (TPR) repeat protein